MRAKFLNLFWPWRVFVEYERVIASTRAATRAIADKNNCIVVDGRNVILSDITIHDGRQIYVTGAECAVMNCCFLPPKKEESETEGAAMSDWQPLPELPELPEGKT